MLKSAIAGDAKALEKLEKQAAAAEADQNRICSELEKLVMSGEIDDAKTIIAVLKARRYLEDRK